ncbi:hypothetical protein DL766_002484 [Monosporascus sp. MC13-8B]|uniref:DUF8212 domain-containing protein n=1 Tax=Monosporascus cannonballus TaxID=155416 RepID=A0ABY0HC96_9PEZI|nr:hypothetical protein DL762_002843 [Monosporascus cannonballus]RYO95580.1 hypothetical protein DL763_003650 [Monosporascus cannonballus]RYP35473.1 hypothetical protein DL766_002484 [Monosporascus sp. MC13-8B]
MPLIYGEGEKAFIRLQEEIMKVLDDHSIFAWKSEKENHRGLLATSPDAFKGSANIIPFNPFIASSSPLTISNKGIHLALRFMGIGRHGLGLAILHCTEIGKEDQLIAIYLRDLSLTMELFERLEDDRRRSPLSYAAEKGNEAIVKLLLARTDIGPAAKDDSGRTSLSYAAEGGHESVMRLLLDKGADIESKDNKGRTPLFWAADREHEAVVRLLLDKGADIKSKDNEGLTPLFWAMYNGHEAIVHLLEGKTAA